MELKPSRTACRELSELGLDLFDVLDILENGYDCERSKRKVGTVERCKRDGRKVLKVVVVDSLQEWDESRVWLVVHAGAIQ
ncbi:MAG: hypothetical protein V1934_01080 [Methanobacteriota archaeon]